MKRVGPKMTRGQSKYIHSDLFFILVKHRMHATTRLPHVVRSQISRNLAATFAKDMRILWPPCPPPPLPLLPHGSQVFPQLFLICYHLRAVLLLAAAKSEGAARRAQKEGCTLSVRVSALSGFSNLNGILRETKTLLFWGATFPQFRLGEWCIVGRGGSKAVGCAYRTWASRGSGLKRRRGPVDSEIPCMGLLHGAPLSNVQVKVEMCKLGRSVMHATATQPGGHLQLRQP